MTDRARELSVNNLQRLYAIVMSLAIAESLRRLLSAYGDEGRLPALASTAAVFSLLITAIPFFHGANRYLESTYVTGERKVHFKTLMFDFFALFLEALTFFILAVVIDQTKVFATILATGLMLGSVWIGVRFLAAASQNRPLVFLPWPVANVLAAVLMLTFAWTDVLRWSPWPSSATLGMAVAVTALARTVYDYYSAWEFYVPSSERDRARSPKRARKGRANH